jgi:hypothetical protein
MTPDSEATATSTGMPQRDGPWPPLTLPPIPAITEQRDSDKGRKKKKRKPEEKKQGTGSARGIETMFRTSYRTHIDMSSLADSKANIMISVNSLILSITLAALASKIDTNSWLLIPLIVLLLSCLVSGGFAVIAARPRVTNRRVTLDDVRQNRANILFFGNFVNLPEDEFVLGMTELLRDPDRLYLNMLRDIYSLGGVLVRKFHYLRISYNVFMGGLVVGVISFIVVLIGVVVIGGQPLTPLGTG